MKTMEVIAIKSGKGGCDKTTATINLAAADAQLFGKNVLVIDTDGRGHNTSLYAKDCRYQIGDVLLGRVSVSEAIVPTKWDHIDCIGCGEEIKDDLKELEKKIFMDPMHRLDKILGEIRSIGKYDRCYIDCSQDPDLMAVNIMLHADRILIPARSDDYSLDGVQKMLEWISQVSDARTQPISYSVMITDKERNKESDDSIAKIEELVKGCLCRTMVRHQAKIVLHSSKESVKIPFVLEKKLAGVALDYIELTKELFHYE